MRDYLDFEKPLAECEEKISRLRDLSHTDQRVVEEIKKLEKKALSLQKEIYSHLTPWQRAQIARHPHRPTTLDYIGLLINGFIELHGDRLFADDHAIVGGIGTFHNRSILAMGHQKGKTTKERVYRNFGMPHPEGYRKALRLMRFSEKFGKPLVTFIDTPGAYPGIGAEERGQAEAIAKNLLVMSHLATPIVAVIIGEGGSGGALALGIGDRVLMLEHSIYSVISPEGCAAILWETAERAVEAADALKITAQNLLDMNIIDEIIPEPVGGAHRDPIRMAESVGQVILKHLTHLENLPIDEILKERYEKIRRVGAFRE